MTLNGVQYDLQFQYKALNYKYLVGLSVSTSGS